MYAINLETLLESFLSPLCTQRCARRALTKPEKSISMLPSRLVQVTVPRKILSRGKSYWENSIAGFSQRGNPPLLSSIFRSLPFQELFPGMKGSGPGAVVLTSGVRVESPLDEGLQAEPRPCPWDARRSSESEKRRPEGSRGGRSGGAEGCGGTVAPAPKGPSQGPRTRTRHLRCAEPGFLLL